MTILNKFDMLDELQKKFPEIENISMYTEYSTGIQKLYVKLKEERLNNSGHIYFNPTENNKVYSTEMLNQVKKEFKAAYKENVKKYKKWLKTPEGKQKVLENKIKKLAREAAFRADEHGAYRSGDDVYINVLDSVNTARDKKKYFVSGEFLALIKLTRVRTYSKQYTRQFGTGKRYDYYLIGENETGTIFAHQVYDNIENIKDALDWVWEENKFTARHGDIAITPAEPYHRKNILQVENEPIVDAHVFTGEMIKNGSIYVKNGILKHLKNQHPDVIVPDQWHKVIIAKRHHKISSRGGTTD